MRGDGVTASGSSATATSSNSESLDAEDDHWEAIQADPRDLHDLIEAGSHQNNENIEDGQPMCIQGKLNALLLWVCHFILLWQTTYLVSDRALEKLLGFLKILSEVIDRQVSAHQKNNTFL